MNSPIQFVTGNDNKFKEAKAIIPKLIQVKKDLVEIQGPSQAIIREKARTAAKECGYPVLVEDICFYIGALGGSPGPYIKWFIKNLGAAGIAKLVLSQKLTKANNYKEHDAIAFANYAFIKNDKTFDSPIMFGGFVCGTIVKPRGDNSFGFDSIFKPKGYDLTYAEMSFAEKNKMSHRRQALDKFKYYLDNGKWPDFEEDA